jgi:hypothetical protein
MRIDHALITSDIAVRSIRDVIVPGSDHRGFIVTLAVAQPA